jgi:ketol-acid reductoisomerase
MALKIVSGPEHAPLDPLRGRTVAVLGYGNQGAAHALNLRDSGLDVVVGNRPDSPRARAAADAGLDVRTIEDAAAAGDLVVVALPDEAQPRIWTERIAPHLRPGVCVGFLHGFAIRYGLVEPPAEAGVVMVAPKGPGRTLRARYERGEGIPCLLAVHQDAPSGGAEALALAWANGIGCARAAIVYTSFADETDTDLFGEQSVLCGGMTSLILAAFDTLVEAGYPPALAYMECCQEVKQVADLVYERGPAAMMEAISNTAEFGAHHVGPMLVDDAVVARMRSVLRAVRDGTFAATMMADHAAGSEWFEEQRRALRDHAIEAAGREVRAWMPWLASDTP